MVEEGDFGYGFHGNPRDPYHVGAIRQLTQCTGSRMPEMVEEINAALADEIIFSRPLDRLQIILDKSRNARLPGII